MGELSATTDLTSRVIKTELINWKSLKFVQHGSFKEWVNTGDKKLVSSLLKYNFIDPFKVWQDGDTLWCLDGFHRFYDLELIEKSGVKVPETLPGTFLQCDSMKDAAELVIVYSSIYAKITQQGLYDFIDKYAIDFDDIKTSIDIPDFDTIDFESLLNKDIDLEKDFVAQSLAEKFIIPPFSIFDTRQGYWQDRKRLWSKLFDSQASREDVELIAQSGQSSAIYELRNKMRSALKREPEWDEIIAEARKRKMHIYEGASIFDPVLAEICYRWFCPEGGSILDPFAGGSVRGIVAGLLGYPYVGIDLRQEQVQANIEQWKQVRANNAANVAWLTGDSNTVLDELSKDQDVDFIFSCPPYHDLEQYSDDPADLSNMDYEQFCEVYWSIIRKSIHKLKPNRFACFVVSDIRDKDGFYRDFVSLTIEAFTTPVDACGQMHLYNEIILVNVAGSLPIRVGRMFDTGRKVGKMHQNVLVFYKGDPKKIREEFPTINTEEYLQELNYQPNIALTTTG